MDLDETFPVRHHFGAGAVVAALALAAVRKATGSQFLQGLIAGYELGGASQVRAGCAFSASLVLLPFLRIDCHRGCGRGVSTGSSG
ncbi:hypothetical protein [Bradyrhizobium arachidis]|uniref:Uncharacterized protein n=1 Tax=Bradyrhizobium arachidis TaxID=858423 RepID=A0AAE7TFW7_9BRAD|nr:hypothetical protein WN72_09880 [Bradyrhizobium arachidis]